MGGFSVDTDAVKTFGMRISQVCADLGDAAVASDLSDAEAGSGDVGEALREFHAHWKQQQDTLLKNLGSLGKTISDAGKNYGESDAAVATATKGGRGQ